jgi:hypothetical protein
MNDKDDVIKTHAPDRLLRAFNNNRIVLALVIAVAAHVVVIGATSMSYIRDTYIDPEGAAQRKAAAEAAAKAAMKAAAGVSTNAPAAAPTDATKTNSAPKAVTSAVEKTDAQLMEERKGSPVIKAITDVAKPDEIPKQPDDIGISIKDIKVR